MKFIQTNRICSIIVIALATTANAACAQPALDDEPLPPRSFLRIGASKLRHGSRILCLAYSPDGEVLAAGGGNDPFRMWNPKTGALIREINEPWVHAIAFTPSGETMLFASLQKHIRLWNFKLNKETAKLEGHKAPVKALAVAPDTSVIASASQDGAIYLWDWNTKRKVEELYGHADEVTALVYTPDNYLLISAGSGGVIHFWDTETYKTKFKLDAGCSVHALAISADSKTLYSAGDDCLIRRWDVPTRKQTGTFAGHEGAVVSLILQGDMLVSGALDRTIRFWDVKAATQLRSLSRRQGDCDALALTKSGDFLATAGLNSAIRIFAVATGKEVVLGPGPQAGLTALIAAPNRRHLVSLALDGQVVVWDASTGKSLREWDSKHNGQVLVTIGPDGKTLATAADVVRFWNADTGTETAELPNKADDVVVSLAFAPDGKTLAVGRRSAQIDLWDWTQKKTIRSFKYAGSLQALAWSPDGKLLAAAGGSKIMVWDPRAGELFKAFDVKEGPPFFFPQVASLAFGPDSRTLAAGCFDAAIRVYNLYATNPTSEKEHRLCEGHLSMPHGIAFSPDGRTLVSGSFDRTVRLWEAFSGKQIAQFKGHIGPVMGVAFAADGRSVYSAGADARVYQWDVPGLLNNGKLPDITLTLQELENAWTALANEETMKGHDTIWRCIASANQAVPLMTKKLYLLDPERVKKLFRDLDSNNYGIRAGAMGELSNYGRWMEGRYNAAMAHPPSLEYKRRVESLRDRLNTANTPSLAQERLRVRRFMLMCEQCGSPDAIEALQKLADKGPEEELQEEAKGSLRRLRKN